YAGPEVTQTTGPPRLLLRQRSERPCDTRAKKRDEFAPPHHFPSAEMLLQAWVLSRLLRGRASHDGERRRSSSPATRPGGSRQCREAAGVAAPAGREGALRPVRLNRQNRGAAPGRKSKSLTRS